MFLQGFRRAEAQPARQGQDATLGHVDAVEQEKKNFARALLEFVGALDGKFRGDGNKVWVSIESMHRALLEWDESIREFEVALSSRQHEAGMHLAMGRVYLSRGRLEEAIGELVEATELEPDRAVRTPCWGWHTDAPAGTTTR